MTPEEKRAALARQYIMQKMSFTPPPMPSSSSFDVASSTATARPGMSAVEQSEPPYQMSLTDSPLMPEIPAPPPPPAPEIRPPKPAPISPPIEAPIAPPEPAPQMAMAPMPPPPAADPAAGGGRSKAALIGAAIAGLGDAISARGGVRTNNMQGALQGIEGAKKGAREDAAFADQQALAKSKKDPNSQASQRARDLAKKLTGKDFAGASAYDLEQQIPTLTKLYEIDQKTLDRKESREDRKALRETALGLKEEARDEKNRQNLDKQTTKYSDTLQKTGIPGALAVGEEVLRQLPAKGDIPGYGMFDGLRPDILTGQKGKDMRQSVQRLFNIELKDRGGTAISDQELERLKAEFGTGSWKTESQLRKGIQMYTQRLAELARNVDAGADPRVIEEYQDRGGRDIKSSTGALARRAGNKDQAAPDYDAATRWAMENPDDPRSAQILARVQRGS